MAAAVARLGQGRVKPSVYFSSTAQTASSPPATTSHPHAISHPWLSGAGTAPCPEPTAMEAGRPARFAFPCRAACPGKAAGRAAAPELRDPEPAGEPGDRRGGGRAPGSSGEVVAVAIIRHLPARQGL